MTTIDDREKDIQKVCAAILNNGIIGLDNPNGAYESSCPFCYAEEHRGGKDPRGIWAKMSELDHKADCAYLIAKDLSTRIKIND